jgi:hypothetical protein
MSLSVPFHDGERLVEIPVSYVEEVGPELAKKAIDSDIFQTSWLRRWNASNGSRKRCMALNSLIIQSVDMIDGGR